MTIYIDYRVIYKEGPRAGSPLSFNTGTTRNMKQLLKHQISSLRLGWLAPKLGILVTAGLVTRKPAFDAWYTSQIGFSKPIPSYSGIFHHIPHYPGIVLFQDGTLITCVCSNYCFWGTWTSQHVVLLAPVFGLGRTVSKSSNTLPMPLVDVMPSTSCAATDSPLGLVKHLFAASKSCGSHG